MHVVGLGLLGSKRRYRQGPSSRRASDLIVDGIVLDGCPRPRTVPEGDWTTKSGQWVQGLSFGLSSAAALAVHVGPWPRVAAVLAGAVANAWGAATCLHQELVRLAALRSGWESL